MTSVGPRNVPDKYKGAGIGLASYGRKSRPDMIKKLREHAQRNLEIAQYTLSLTDEEIIVETYTGVWAQNNVKEVTE
jgi:predicted CopG family antitoxin